MKDSTPAERRLAEENRRLDQARRDQDAFKVSFHLERRREAQLAVANERGEG